MSSQASGNLSGMQDRHIAARNAARFLVTLAIVAAHLSFAVLDSLDRLSFTVDSEYHEIQRIAESDAWLPLNLGIAVSLLLTLGKPKWHTKALSASFASMGSWSFFTLLWGMYPISKVSLAGPVLGLVVAAIAQFVALSYSTRDNHERQG